MGRFMTETLYIFVMFVTKPYNSPLTKKFKRFYLAENNTSKGPKKQMGFKTHAQLHWLLSFCEHAILELQNTILM